MSDSMKNLPGLPGETPRIGVIVQARMTSKRFPGKSMALLDGRPVIFRVLDRCMVLSRFVSEVILAIPDEPESDVMEEAVKKEFPYPLVKIFRGERDDVLDRYHQCALYYKLDYILRITGDCPYIDPQICLDVMALLVNKQLDYTCNVHPKRTFPKGLDCEFFTMDALECAHLFGKDPYSREHVTPWMKSKRGLLRGSVKNNEDHSEENLCVDFPEDIPRLEKIIYEYKERVKQLTVESSENVQQTN